MTSLDFTGMRPSDALAKAHKAYPFVRWDWHIGVVRRPRGHIFRKACAAALLEYASGLEEFDCDGGFYRIADLTRCARSFPEAVRLLREAGL